MSCTPYTRQSLLQLLDALNRHLKHVEGYQPIRFNQLVIILDQLSTTSSASSEADVFREVGGRVYLSGVVKLNENILREDPAAVFHMLIHEVGHLVSARYIGEQGSKRVGLRFTNRKQESEFSLLNEAVIENSISIRS